MDLFIDEGEIWSTVAITGATPVRRAIPTKHGRSSGTAWRLHIDSELPGTIAAAMSEQHVSPRALEFVQLIALAAEIVETAGLVPKPAADDWCWQVAVGSDMATRVIERAGRAGSTALMRAGDNLLETYTQWLSRIANALAGPVDPPPEGGTRAAWHRWADLVTARRGANARLVIRVDPPDTRGWLLVPLAVALDSLTTRVLAGQAKGIAEFTQVTELWEKWLREELLALRTAWPDSPLADLTPVEPALEELLEFLDSHVLRLRAAGIDVLAPAGLLHGATVRRRASVSAGAGFLSRAALLLEASVEVDGESLSDAEVAALAHAKMELVSVRGRWLRVSDADRQRLSRLLAAQGGEVSLADVLTDEAFDGVELDASALSGLRIARQVTVPPAVHAELRPYQRDGLDWLTWIEENGTGGILADDMGLGKTLQVLARVTADHSGPTLVVCPVTLVDTWLRQAEMFTPGLRMLAHHGAARSDVATDLAADVVVTTYGLLSRDPSLSAVPWHRVVLDEAQAIKNPDTKVARAARALTARHRLAVTGTPVENHVGDLWSLFAFTTPGLLPRRAAFRRRFGGADSEPESLQILRSVTAPFVLRRVKSDPHVAPDLPDRVVVRDDCAMTHEQVGAYEAAVRSMLESLDDGGGIRRRATVLATISRLKQICVHPALLTESRKRLAGRSGKIERLVELCAEILEEGQAVVVFTQFASFAQDLAAHLEKGLGVPVLTLTGSDSRARRAEVVSSFGVSDGPPILVASIKAGGTGLTLVRANHVVHLDRWWNPAVEDQASDRVWRIGQHEKVVVHTMVCPGTLEERIDTMLTAKRGLAAAVVRSTEAAVTEMSAEELSELVTLVRERVIE